MKRFAWMLSGMVPLASLGSPCAAQQATLSPPVVQISAELPPRCNLPPPCPCPGEPQPSELPKPPAGETPSTPTPPSSPGDDLLSGEGGAKGIGNLGTLVAGGTGLSVAANVAGRPTLVNTPLILPGIFTAASVQSALPMDRVGFDYGYFSGFRIPNPTTLTGGGTTVSPGMGTRDGFNLNTYNIDLEKSFFDGLGSIYVSVPFLYASDNISGQRINGLGDISAGFKIVLLNDTQTGSALTTGLTVAAPTGHEAVVTSFVANATGTGFTPSTTTSLNPTYFQPWVAGVWVHDHLVVQEYFGVLIPSDDQVATFINNSLSVGYTVYQSKCSLISSVTPIAGVQALLPLNHVGVPPDAPAGNLPIFNLTHAAPAPSGFGFSDQVFVSGGVQVGLGERSLLSTSVEVPVVGPKGYTIGFMVGFSLFY